MKLSRVSMDKLKFDKISYEPKQLLGHCFEHEDFKKVMVIGINQDGELRWVTSTKSFDFLAYAAIFLMSMSQKELNITENKK